ncbi:hypothetical protein HOD75_00420 [archaeon]|jgi:hypothetical protein|nr:hypothetical protein [archaeon]MBT4241340.1 hypothetical protein [archaeon]MBT4418161.1 hypothetical protein [archaeon]
MEDYKEIFAQIGKKASQTSKERCDEEWATKGFHLLKRRTLGFCGTSTTMNNTDLAKLLVEIGAKETPDAALKLISDLHGRELDYDSDFYQGECMSNRRALILRESEMPNGLKETTIHAVRYRRDLSDDECAAYIWQALG